MAMPRSDPAAVVVERMEAMCAQFMLRTVAIAMMASLTGCSLLINCSGESLRNLDTREIVYERFGPPDSVSVLHAVDPQTSEARRFDVEHYHVHAKFNTAMPMGSGSVFMLLVEPIMTCQALLGAAGEIIKGHDLAFVYDDQGNTIGRQGPLSSMEALRNYRDKTNVLHWERPDDGDVCPSCDN